MTATLTFNLPEDESEFTYARQGAQLACAVADFDDWLRNLVKHTSPDKWPSTAVVRQELLNRLAATGLVLHA